MVSYFQFFSCSVFQNSGLFGATDFEIIVRNFTPSRQLTGSSPNSTHYEWFRPICILITTTPSSTSLPLLLSLLVFKLPGGGTWSAAAWLHLRYQCPTFEFILEFLYGFSAGSLVMGMVSAGQEYLCLC